MMGPRNGFHVVREGPSSVYAVPLLFRFPGSEAPFFYSSQPLRAVDSAPKGLLDCWPN